MNGDMGMGCEMDAEGNCIIDSATCAQWMADGKLDSTACVKCEEGKCHIKSDACMKAGGCKMGGNGMNCDDACMKKCQEMGMNCDKGNCPHMNAGNAGMSENHDCSKGCTPECMKECESHGMKCKGEMKDCCKK